MKQIAVASLLLIFVGIPLSLCAQVTTSYSDVLLMVNDSSVNSVDIATYFAQRRSIPQHHIFHFQHDTSKSGDFGETIDSLTFKREILWPLENFMRTRNLVDSINFIVCTKGCPLRVSTPHNAGAFGGTSSFTDCIALANGIDSVKMLTNKPSGPATSRYATDGPLEHFRHSQATMPYYLTTRLDAYTVDQVKALIRRAETPAYVGQGLYVLDEDPGRWSAGYSSGNIWLQAANDSLKARGMTTKLDTTVVYLTKQTGVIGYCSWGSNDGNAGNYATNAIPGNTYLDGAIAETYVSTGGRSFNVGTTYGQSLIADLIAEGVTGVKGYTDEPYLGVMAEPQLLFPRFADGYYLAECYWSASPWIAWRQVVIGDPKMTMRIPAVVSTPSLSFGDHDRYASATKTFSLRNVSNLTLTVKPVVFVEGDSTAYSITPNTPLPRTLAQRDSVTFTVTFRAKTYASASAAVHVPYHLAGNAGDQWLRVDMDGNGIRPKLAVKDTVVFANANVGDSASATIDLHNLSLTDTVLLTGLTLSGNPDFVIRGTVPTAVAPDDIPANQTATYTVEFIPRDTGLRQATLNVRSTASVLKPIPIILRGRGTGTSAVAERLMPATLSISAAYPNPFSDETVFTVHTGDVRDATLKVYDVMGRMVCDLTRSLENGKAVTFNAASLPAGVYACRLVAAGATVERTVVHTK